MAVSFEVPKICETFLSLSVKTWNDLYLSQMTQIDIGEDSITDYRLNELKLSHPNQIFIKRFRGSSEGPEGADWAWLVISGDRCIKMKIQAKRLTYPNNPQYKELWYSREKEIGNRQVDRLINRSKNYSFSPVYCFYNYWDTQTVPAPSTYCSVSRSNCLFKASPFNWGCSLASAFFIRDRINSSQKYLIDILPGCLPWSCIVCCPLNIDHYYPPRPNEPDWVERAKQFLVSLNESDSPENLRHFPEITEIPEPIQKFLSGSRKRWFWENLQEMFDYPKIINLMVQR